jgi:hypothetical protein
MRPESFLGSLAMGPESFLGSLAMAVGAVGSGVCRLFVVGLGCARLMSLPPSLDHLQPCLLGRLTTSLA